MRYTSQFFTDKIEKVHIQRIFCINTFAIKTLPTNWNFFARKTFRNYTKLSSSRNLYYMAEDHHSPFSSVTIITELRNHFTPHTFKIEKQENSSEVKKQKYYLKFKKMQIFWWKITTFLPHCQCLAYLQLKKLKSEIYGFENWLIINPRLRFPEKML